MTKDRSLTERLRSHGRDWGPVPSGLSELIFEAAEEIEGLRHDVDRLTDALTAEVNAHEPGEKPFNFRDARGILAQTETRDTSTIIEARKDWSEPTIESFESRMSIDKNGIEAFAEFRGDAVKAWCGIAVDWFRSVGGKSYVTMDFTDSRDGEHYTFTVQRAGGDSPASKIQRLEAELAALNREGKS